MCIIGADIANVCNEAAIYTAREKDEYVDDKHFDYAIERIIAGILNIAIMTRPKTYTLFV